MKNTNYKYPVEWCRNIEQSSIEICLLRGLGPMVVVFRNAEPSRFTTPENPRIFERESLYWYINIIYANRSCFGCVRMR